MVCEAHLGVQQTKVFILPVGKQYYKVKYYTFIDLMVLPTAINAVIQSNGLGNIIRLYRSVIDTLYSTFRQSGVVI